MSLPPIQSRQYDVEFLTEHFIFAGTLEPFGQLMIYLNDADRKTIALKNVKASSLDAGGTIDHFQAGELYFRRDEIIAVRPHAPLSSATMPLMPRPVPLRVFIPRFVVQATFHTGPETRAADIFDGSGYWAAGTDARVHHLLPPRHPVFHDAHALLINKKYIRFYQPIESQPPTG